MSRSITSQAMTSHQGEDVREWSSGISDEQKECFRPASSGEVSGKQLSLFNSFILFLRVHYLTMLLNAEIIWHRYTWINEWMNEFEALGNTEILGENPSQCLFVCRKCYMDRPGTEPEPRWWQALASSSIPSTVNDFFFSTPPILWVPGDIFSWEKMVGVWRQLISVKWGDWECVVLCLHFTTYLHGTGLNYSWA